MSAPRLRRSYTQDFKDELCHEVINTSKLIVDVARCFGVGTRGRRRWLMNCRDIHNSPDAAATGAELARLKELEKENQELRAEILFLKSQRLLREESNDSEQDKYFESQRNYPAETNPVAKMCR